MLGRAGIPNKTRDEQIHDRRVKSLRSRAQRQREVTTFLRV